MTQDERNGQLEQAKYKKYPGPARFVAAERQYKVRDVPDWVLKMLEQYARHLNSWVPITCEEDLKQPPGLYWTTFVDEDGMHVGSDRLYRVDSDEEWHDEFAANTLAYIRIEEPEPWKDK